MRHRRISSRLSQRWRLLISGIALIALALTISIGGGDGARGSAVLVVIEDASALGSGSFSGNVCYQVARDQDGVVISAGCFAIAVSVVAPAGFDPTLDYTIQVTVADANCVLLDDPRSGTGESPFRVRVSCDAAWLTATAASDTIGVDGDPPMSSIEWDYRNQTDEEAEPTVPATFRVATGSPVALPIAPTSDPTASD